MSNQKNSVYNEELETRRACWVREMYERFSEKKGANMAFAAHGHNPKNYWVIDRVTVACFTDKNRSKVTAGVSRVFPGDHFDYDTGVAIAFARAIGEPVPDLF